MAELPQKRPKLAHSVESLDVDISQLAVLVDDQSVYGLKNEVLTLVYGSRGRFPDHQMRKLPGPLPVSMGRKHLQVFILELFE